MILKFKAKYLKMINLFKHLKSILKKILNVKFIYFNLFSDLIRNIAKKYNLEITQITVSSVEEHGLTSFQIMPFFNENMDAFDEKMDLIDNEVSLEEEEKIEISDFFI